MEIKRPGRREGGGYWPKLFAAETSRAKSISNATFPDIRARGARATREARRKEVGRKARKGGSRAEKRDNRENTAVDNRDLFLNEFASSLLLFLTNIGAKIALYFYLVTF